VLRTLEASWTCESS